jgi:hypothetical protein
MKPTNKHPAINLFLSGLARKSRTITISEGECMSCDSTGIVATSFHDDISRKEYAISGLCQSCQDDVFGHGEPDEDENDEEALASAGFGMDESYNDGGAYREDFGYFGEMGMMED